jgi:two-component system, OmpR family, sensor histidine kinase MtrB
MIGLRVRSLRFRIAFAYIVGTLAVCGLVAIGTYVITSRVLTNREYAAAANQSFAAVDFLNDQIAFIERGEVSIRELEVSLREQGLDVVVSHPTRPAESTSIGVTEETIPPALRELVAEGGVGRAIFAGPGYRRLAFGTPIPHSRPRIATYFVYSLEGLDRTLSILWRVLLGVVAAAVGLAGAVGLRLADRTIRPLRAAADAARRVAEGHLETRLEESGEDELARLANTFNYMTYALSELIARERRFVADVSHELRTPLTALKTSIDFVAEKASDLSPRARSAIGLAAEEVRALQRLVDDLLELSRAEAGGVHVNREEVDLVNFAREVVRRRAPEAAVSIEGPDELVVHTDKARLERVVGNLVENAVVHGQGEDVRILLDTVDGSARISVADQGPGITDEQITRIFDRFWRGDASRQRDGRVGAGLGLAIARENAALISGELLVESAAGAGTRFVLVLPHEEQP